jgi:hypothetical protein
MTIRPGNRFLDVFFECAELNILVHAHTMETAAVSFERALENNYALTRQRAAEGTLNPQLAAHWEIYQKMFGGDI